MSNREENTAKTRFALPAYYKRGNEPEEKGKKALVYF
jgi:hypothetical protein